MLNWDDPLNAPVPTVGAGQPEAAAPAAPAADVTSTPVEETIPDADAKILRENGISITPIHYDLSSQDEIGRLRAQSMPEYENL